MGRKEGISGRKNEQGIVIALVAVVMLFVVGAMAALSIDVVTLYTARSEAQLAADAGALAGARTLANSGMTSGASPGLITSAEALAVAVATQVAASNQVGGRNLNPAGTSPCTVGQEICVSFNDSMTTFGTNPHVTVQAMRADLPTFFARIWGSTQIKVSASATAEAYNPSPAPGALTRSGPPVAPICVKPWLLPNMDPSPGGTTIFDSTSGAITNPSLTGWTSTGAATRLRPQCTSCTMTPLPTPNAWRYYPGDTATTFLAPTQAVPTCTPALNPGYEESIAGCVQTAIACNGTANIDTTTFPGGRNTATADAVNCLTHATATPGDADQVDLTVVPSPPFEFLAGTNNPIASARGKDVVVSDSLVTVPVFNSTTAAPTSPVTIIGFVQLFLNPDGVATPIPPAMYGGHPNTTIINMAGCGTGATGQPILGNGASPVAVRLISP